MAKKGRQGYRLLLLSFLMLFTTVFSAGSQAYAATQSDWRYQRTRPFIYQRGKHTLGIQHGIRSPSDVFKRWNELYSLPSDL